MEAYTPSTGKRPLQARGPCGVCQAGEGSSWWEAVLRWCRRDRREAVSESPPAVSESPPALSESPPAVSESPAVVGRVRGTDCRVRVTDRRVRVTSCRVRVTACRARVSASEYAQALGWQLGIRVLLMCRALHSRTAALSPCAVCAGPGIPVPRVTHPVPRVTHSRPPRDPFSSPA